MFMHEKRVPQLTSSALIPSSASHPAYLAARGGVTSKMIVPFEGKVFLPEVRRVEIIKMIPAFFW
jgi:hypothetical protein